MQATLDSDFVTHVLYNKLILMLLILKTFSISTLNKKIIFLVENEKM